MKKVYISGKIGGDVLDDETRAKFKKAEDMLRGKGYDVFNPTESGLGRLAEHTAKTLGTSFYKEILVYDLHALKVCDFIYMLKDWKCSPGAKVELEYANATGIRKLFENEADAREFGENCNKWEEAWLPI